MAVYFILLVLLSLFYADYFYKQLALRRRGISTNRLGRGEKPRRTARIEGLLLAATISTAVVQYGSVLFHRYLPVMGFPLWVRVAGLAATACGAVFFLLATLTMRDSWRAGVDATQKTAMVTTGVYRVSRNPAFVGFDLLYIGSFLAAPNWILLVCILAAILLLHLQIREEEAYLPGVFGEAYLDYKRRVPRYLLFR